MDLIAALNNLAESEGVETAVNIAERWRNTLEEMADAMSKPSALRNGLLAVMETLNHWLNKRA